MKLSDEQVSELLAIGNALDDEHRQSTYIHGPELRALCREVLAARRMRDALELREGPFGAYLDFEDAPACEAVKTYDQTREGNASSAD